MRKRNQIPTFLGIILLVAGVFTGVYFVGLRQVFRIGADASTTPKDIRVSNQTDSSATVTWVTDKETTGFIIWGNSKNSVNRIEKETEGNEKFYTHSITLTGLDPSTTYFYKINSDGNTFDNSGLPWELSTGAELSENTVSSILSGSVLSGSGTPAKRALVYANLNGYTLSTVSSDTGGYVFQLGLTRSSDLNSYLDILPAGTLVEISVEHEGGVASAQIFPQSGNPVPPIILGQVYNFRDLEPSTSLENPNVKLSLPGDVPKESKFNFPLITGTPTPGSVILESLKEGEVITSSKPAFFGRGPAGQNVTITVESDPITESFKIKQDGTWTWTPPASLASGAHKVTISWADSTGVTRIITRTFIVQAGEVPSFEATPSQTLAPTTPTPAPTILATATPSPTPRITATPAGTSSATTSAAPAIPQTGEFGPTLILTIIGAAILTFSLMLWRYSEI